MRNFVADMLHGRLPIDVPFTEGRKITFADMEPDIKLTTGPMRERVILFMFINRIPCMIREIVSGIGSNPSRVTKSLKELVGQGEVECIKHEGCAKEYCLTHYGLSTEKSLNHYGDKKVGEAP